MRIPRRLLTTALCAALAFTLLAPSKAQAAAPDHAPAMDAIAAKYRAAKTLYDWPAIALAAYDRGSGNAPAATYRNYNVKARVAQLKGGTNYIALSDYARVAIALNLQNESANTFLVGKGYTDAVGNSVNSLTGAIAQYSRQYTANGIAFSLLALDSGNYSTPAACKLNRNKLISALLAKMKKDAGGGTDLDRLGLDMGGIAMQALAPYYSSRADVKAAVDRLLTSISALQKPDGSFAPTKATPASSETTAQLIIGLSALGIDADADPRFVKDASALSGLMGFAVAAGNGFEHEKGKGENDISTSQGLLALCAYDGFARTGGAYNVYAAGDHASEALPSKTTVKSFTLKLGNKKYGAKISGDTIRISGLPRNAKLTQATATAVHDGAAIAPLPNETFSLTSPKTFTVIAANGGKREYKVVTKTYKTASKLPASMKVGAALKLSPSVKGKTGVSVKSLNAKVVSATKDGYVEAKAKGKATLQVKVQYRKNGKTLSKNFTYKTTVK